jgi:hypothetical protein
MDRGQLADFLRRRRAALQPGDVGLPRGPRRRTIGLRREEVAALCGMSVDYYNRLEQRRGPQSSEAMAAALARGLRLSLDERDHLFRLCGHGTPRRTLLTDHVNPGLMRVLDRLADTPAQVMNRLGETLVQTRLAVALLGDETHYTGLSRSAIYRWFTDPIARQIYPHDSHAFHGRVLAAELRAAFARDGAKSRAGEIVAQLLAHSHEFAHLWGPHEVGLRHAERKQIAHSELGVLELHCQSLVDLDQEQALLVFTATPGTESYEKLQLLAVIGTQRLNI